jgi:hypothetical protein
MREGNSERTQLGVTRCNIIKMKHVVIYPETTRITPALPPAEPGSQITIPERLKVLSLDTEPWSINPLRYEVLHPRGNTIQVCPSERCILAPPESDN